MSGAKGGDEAMDCPSAEQIGAKWGRVTPQRAEDFEQGVKAPKKDWAAETAAKEGAFEDGVKKAMARKAFGKGVRAAGTGKQQAATIAKGVDEGRWAAGVQIAEPNMVAGMEPVVRALAAVRLPPGFAKGDPRNYERVKAVGTALHKMKTGE